MQRTRSPAGSSPAKLDDASGEFGDPCCWGAAWVSVTGHRTPTFRAARDAQPSCSRSSDSHRRGSTARTCELRLEHIRDEPRSLLHRLLSVHAIVVPLQGCPSLRGVLPMCRSDVLPVSPVCTLEWPNVSRISCVVCDRQTERSEGGREQPRLLHPIFS
jgi:hypothetical protein